MLRFVLLWVGLLAGAAAWAGEPPGRYAFRSLGGEQGLRNSAVTALAQDRTGHVFVGTEDGLYRFDGQRFEAFGVDEGLPSASVSLLHMPRRGPLWVATSKGLLAWAGDAPARGTRAVLTDVEILGMASSDAGALLLSTEHGSLLGVPPALRPLPGAPEGPGAGWISPDGREVLLARRGTLHRRDAQGRWTERALPAARSGDTPQTILRDRDGRWWIRGRRMLLRLAAFDAPFEDLTAQLPGAANQKGELLLDARGRVWAPTNRGIAYFDGDAVGRIDSRHGLPTQWATTVLRDRDGSLWVGSEGVHQAQGRLAWSAYTHHEGLPSDTVWGVIRDRAGTLWVATNRGVASAHDDGWRVLPGSEERSFYTFAESAAGDLWIGGNTGDSGTNTLLRRRAGQPAFAPVPLASVTGPSTVNSIAFGPDGALYVATLAHGLHRFVATDGGFRSEAVALPGGTATEQINQLIRDARGRLWVAGMRGAAVFDGRAWRRLTLRDGLREIEVATLTAAGDAVWVSYWNVDGLTWIQLDGGRASVRQITGPEALVGDTVYTVGLDPQGLWLGTAAGIKRWRPSGVERFGRADGLPGDDAAANAFWVDANGDRWFGMANGLAHYHADQGGVPVTPPATVIQAVADGRGEARPEAAPQVEWGARALTFEFAALNHLDPAQLQREVRLVGFEDEWRRTGIGEARYTGLLPGRYRFEARARYGDGAFGPVVAREVEILPPWWLTGWFFALAAAALVSMVVLGVRWRLARLRRHNATLEALVVARTQELQQANAALEQASMVDPLTGLKNRRFLSIFMPEELARVRRQQRIADDRSRGRHNTDLCLLLVDLDHFKQVNDVHGHAAGDAVLRQLGVRLLGVFRESDVVVRWGGEEFLILARNTDRTHVGQLAEAVCEAVRATPFDLGTGTALRKTCSVGATALPLRTAQPGAYDWEAALELADQCLYAAKRAGRDGWVTFLLDAPADAPPLDAQANAAALAAAGWGRLDRSSKVAQAVD